MRKACVMAAAALLGMSCEAGQVQQAQDAAPDLPPPPAPVEYEMRVRVVKVEGRTLDVEVSTNLPRWSEVRVSAWRDMRRPDPPQGKSNAPARRWDKPWYEGDPKGEWVRGEVCASAALVVKTGWEEGWERWRCEVSDTTWYERERAEGIKRINRDQITIRAEWSSGVAQRMEVRAVLGEQGERLRGPCLGRRKGAVTCADEITYPMPFAPGGAQLEYEP